MSDPTESSFQGHAVVSPQIFVSRRKRLALALITLCVAGFAAFSGVLLATLRPSAQALDSSEVVIQLAPMTLGEVQTFNIHGRPLFVLRPDARQRQSIAQLDAHVLDQQSKAYVPELDAFAYWGVSTNRGCALEHKLPQPSALLQWVSDAQWLGGFWGAGCELSYDYAGRTINSYQFTFNGYRGKFENLERPKLKFSGNLVIVQMR